MSKTNNILLLILFIFGLIGSFYLGTVYNKINSPYIYRIDTVKVLVKPDTIYFDSIKTNIKYRYKTIYDTLNMKYSDTIYKTLPFIASIDTVTVNKDSVSLQYWFPEQMIKNLRVKPHEFEHKVVYKMDTVQIMKDYKWYDKALWILGGVGIGMTGGVIIWK